MTVKIRSWLSTRRNANPGDPHGGVLHALLFKVPLAFLPISFLEPSSPKVHFAFYADDIALSWYVPITHGSPVCTALQRGIYRNAVCVNRKGRKVSPEKRASICRFRPRRPPKFQNTVYLSGRPIARVRTDIFLELLVNDKTNSRPAAKKMPSSWQCYLFVLQGWGYLYGEISNAHSRVFSTVSLHLGSRVICIS